MSTDFTLCLQTLHYVCRLYMMSVDFTLFLQALCNVCTLYVKSADITFFLYLIDLLQNVINRFWDYLFFNNKQTKRQFEIIKHWYRELQAC